VSLARVIRTLADIREVSLVYQEPDAKSLRTQATQIIQSVEHHSDRRTGDKI
jgi:hypothetical protein